MMHINNERHNWKPHLASTLCKYKVIQRNVLIYLQS